MENNKVYLSFGRHGRYGRDTAVDRLSMLEAYLSGRFLIREYPPCDTLFYSPIARATQTATFRALGLGCTHNLEAQKLSEDTPTFEVRKFINTLLINCHKEKHLHFVTHLPIIEKLGLGELSCGEVCILEAKNWPEMLSENFELKILPVPDIEESAACLQKIGYLAQEFNLAPPEDIFNRLALLHKP